MRKNSSTSYWLLYQVQYRTCDRVRSVEFYCSLPVRNAIVRSWHILNPQNLPTIGRAICPSEVYCRLRPENIAVAPQNQSISDDDVMGRSFYNHRSHQINCYWSWYCTSSETTGLGKLLPFLPVLVYCTWHACGFYESPWKLILLDDLSKIQYCTILLEPTLMQMAQVECTPRHRLSW